MHTIEPFYNWIEIYNSSKDELSPFFGKKHSEFYFENTIYNHYIHPQWDVFESDTLFLKILYVDYFDNYAIIELMGEWNDCITNDIMLLKRNIIELLQQEGITKFILIGENVLNFHGDDDSYYEEWADEADWIVLINFREHVLSEMINYRLHYYLNITEFDYEIYWRKMHPSQLFKLVNY